MGAKIIWSDNAVEDYKKVIDYLLLEWNEQMGLKLIETVEHKLEQIATHPYIGILSAKDPHIRKYFFN